MANASTTPQLTAADWQSLRHAFFSHAMRHGTSEADADEVTSAVILRLLEPSRRERSGAAIGELLASLQVFDELEVSALSSGTSRFTITTRLDCGLRLKGARGRLFDLVELDGEWTLGPTHGPGESVQVESVTALVRAPAARMTVAELRMYGMRAVHNMKVSDWRSRKVRERYADEAKGVLHRTGCGQFEHAVAGETCMLDRLDAATVLDSLRPGYSRVLELTVVEGLTTAEAGEELGVRPGTIQSRGWRARDEARSRFALGGGDVTISVSSDLSSGATTRTKLVSGT